MSTHSLIHDTLGALATHRDLIEAAYTQGSIARSAENHGDVVRLQQMRIFVADGRDHFRLSRNLTRFMDEITQKQRLFEMLGGNIEVLLDRLQKVREEYSLAFYDGRQRDMDQSAADFHDACAEIADVVTSSISRLLQQAESNFAAVGSMAAKERQNKHYLDQSEKLGMALNAMMRSHTLEDLEAHGEMFAPLAQSYRRLIYAQQIEWNTELGRIGRILNAFLYRLRQIAPEVRRLRSFARFLQQNPSYSPPALDEMKQVPEWLMRDPGIRPTAYPTFAGDGVFYPELVAIANKLPAPKVSIRPPQEAGELQRRSSDSKPIKLDYSAPRVALLRLALDAMESPRPLSAVWWKRKHAADLNITDDMWLLLVMHTEHLEKLPFTKVKHRRVSRFGDSRISANIFIKDVFLERKH